MGENYQLYEDRRGEDDDLIGSVEVETPVAGYCKDQPDQQCRIQQCTGQA